jgi:Fe-S cluster assembly ATP-binding protein
MTTPMLEIRDLRVTVGDREILKGVNLVLPKGEVHAVMGRNGSGKSTLSYALAGRAGYDVTGGEVWLDGQDLLAMEPDARATAGLFLAFQYPIEIPGVATMTFLKAAMNAQRKTRGEAELTTPDFMRAVKEAGSSLHIDNEMLKRALNVGFSGGEKKRAEILQMALLKPKMCILDETDSGLDIDALKLVSEGVNALRGPDRSMLVITHYQRLLNHIVPDVVHVFSDGKVVESGGKELALELESKGYAGFDEDVAA